jgi:hypothetical protein
MRALVSQPGSKGKRRMERMADGALPLAAYGLNNGRKFKG